MSSFADMMGNLGQGLGQGLANYQDGRVGRKRDLHTEALEAMASGDHGRALQLAQEADKVSGLFGPLSPPRGPAPTAPMKAIAEQAPGPSIGAAPSPRGLAAGMPTPGTPTPRFGLEPNQGLAAGLPTSLGAPPAEPNQGLAGLAAYRGAGDPITTTRQAPDETNPDYIEAARKYVGAPIPKADTFNLGYGERRYSQVPGQAPKLMATGGAKPMADKDPRYDIDPVTGEVKPVVPGTRFGVKPDKPEKPDKDTSAKDYQKAFSDWQKDGARYVNDYVSLMARNSQRTRVQNGVTMTVPPTPEQMKAWRSEGEALYKASVNQPMPPGGSGKPDPFANPKSPSAQKVSGGTARWAKQITAASQATGVPEAIIRAVMRQESGGNPSARSPVGAIGLMQFMPGTAAGMGINPADPDQAVLAGAKYLKANYEKFGSWKKAIAAYNAGPGAVQKYGGIPPYKETQGYVQRIADDLKRQGIEISAADAAKAASLYEKYGITPGAANA